MKYFFVIYYLYFFLLRAFEVFDMSMLLQYILSVKFFFVMYFLTCLSVYHMSSLLLVAFTTYLFYTSCLGHTPVARVTKDIYFCRTIYEFPVSDSCIKFLEFPSRDMCFFRNSTTSCFLNFTASSIGVNPHLKQIC